MVRMKSPGGDEKDIPQGGVSSLEHLGWSRVTEEAPEEFSPVSEGQGDTPGPSETPRKPRGRASRTRK